MHWKMIDMICFEKWLIRHALKSVSSWHVLKIVLPCQTLKSLLTCFALFVAYPCHKFFWWTPIVYIVLSVASLIVALATWGNVLLGHIGDSHHDEIWSHRHRWWDLTSLFSLRLAIFEKSVWKQCSFVFLIFRAGQQLCFEGCLFQNARLPGAMCLGWGKLDGEGDYYD